MKTLRVSVAQITCIDGSVEQNLSRAYDMVNEAGKKSAELVLFPEFMPHSYCTPTIPNKLTTSDDIERLKNLPLKVARLYNDFLGVPVLLCNKSGKWDSPVPNKILGSPKDFAFSGISAIIDADGTCLVELDDNETIGYGRVNLDQALKKNGTIPKYSRYIYSGPAGREIIRLMEFKGYINYTFNRQRKHKAL